MKKIWTIFVLIFALIFVLGGCTKIKVPEISIEDELKQYTNYPDFVFGCMYPVADAIENIGHQLVGVDVSLLSNKEWLSRIFGQVAIINANCDAIIDYDETLIPENYKYAHSLLLISVNEYKYAMVLLVEFLSPKSNTYDLSKLSKLEDVMYSATDYLVEATGLIKENQ